MLRLNHPPFIWYMFKSYTFESMLMTVNWSYLFQLRISCKMFLTKKLVSTLSLLGCQLIFSRSISLKLNSYLLVFPKSFLKYLTLLFSCLPMSQSLHLTPLVTSVSYSTLHSPCLNIFPLYLYLAFCLFVTKVDYFNSLFLNLPSLSTWSSSVDSQLCCSCCF